MSNGAMIMDNENECKLILLLDCCTICNKVTRINVGDVDFCNTTDKKKLNISLYWGFTFLSDQSDVTTLCK